MVLVHLWLGGKNSTDPCFLVVLLVLDSQSVLLTHFLATSTGENAPYMQDISINGVKSHWECALDFLRSLAREIYPSYPFKPAQTLDITFSEKRNTGDGLLANKTSFFCSSGRCNVADWCKVAGAQDELDIDTYCIRRLEWWLNNHKE